jgi:transposase, IS5 family
MPWNIRRAFDQVNTYCSDLFLHIASFLCRGVMVPDKALAFHAKAVRCFNKGKLAKGLQCGRAFQLGRIGGNFLLVAPCPSVRMEDTASVRPMIRAYREVCRPGVLASCGMAKGYYYHSVRKWFLLTFREA